MKSKLLVLALLLMVATVTFAQKSVKYHTDAKEVPNAVAIKTHSFSTPSIQLTSPPSGSIPFPINFYDYMTNGNNMKRVYVLGDTIIACLDRTDSASAITSNARRLWYQVSTDGGLTWLPEGVLTLGAPASYGNISPVIYFGSRSIIFTGRQWEGSTTRGGAITEASFPNGVCTGYLNPSPGKDYFGFQFSGNNVVGSYQHAGADPIIDSLYFSKFDWNTNTFTGKVTLANTTADINFNTRQYVAIKPDQNKIAVMWWVASGGVASQGMYLKESTDGGTTFGSKQNVCLNGYQANGDSVAVWFGADVTYNPNNNTPAAAFCTLGFSGGAPNYGTRTGYKLLFWAPNINGGNPVVIADRSNIPFLQTDTSFNNNMVDIQVGMTAISHPSLGWSADGSRLYCVYSVTQRDTINYGPVFNFNDIALSYSTNGGANWIGPLSITKTAQEDEIYPTISPTGNIGNDINVVYNWSQFPGSCSFSDNAPIGGPTYMVFKKIDINTLPPIGIKKIETEVVADFKLGQNYPNPFNPTTNIQFSVPKNNLVTLKVYDITGKLISTLVNQNLNAGTYNVDFDATKLSSGVYFYTMQAGNFTSTKKMVLIK